MRYLDKKVILRNRPRTAIGSILYLRFPALPPLSLVARKKRKSEVGFFVFHFCAGSRAWAFSWRTNNWRGRGNDEVLLCYHIRLYCLIVVIIPPASYRIEVAAYLFWHGAWMVLSRRGRFWAPPRVIGAFVFDHARRDVVLFMPPRRLYFICAAGFQSKIQRIFFLFFGRRHV